jgi:hypothetical protein
MALIQFLAIVLGTALTAQATSLDVDVSAIDANVNLELSLDHVVLWENTWPKVAQYVPGITCVLGDPLAQKNTTIGELEGCKVIQNELSSIFPGVQCTGKLDEETLTKELTASTEIQASTPRLARRRQDPGLDAAIDRQEQDKDTLIDEKRRSTLLVCAQAPHPGNCYTCVAGAVASALGATSVCATTAHLWLPTQGKLPILCLHMMRN